MYFRRSPSSPGFSGERILKHGFCLFKLLRWNPKDPACLGRPTAWRVHTNTAALLYYCNDVYSEGLQGWALSLASVPPPKIAISSLRTSYRAFPVSAPHCFRVNPRHRGIVGRHFPLNNPSSVSKRSFLCRMLISHLQLLDSQLLTD